MGRGGENEQKLECCKLCGPFTPHWKVPASSNLRHSVPIEVLFRLVSLFAEVKIFSFWTKTMDYSQAL